ncbi:MAG: ROK family protein [Bacteroidales bacterium]|nr:ROK family protein [Bacteroidales bacterium]
MWEKGCTETYLSKAGLLRMINEKKNSFPDSGIHKEKGELISPLMLSELARKKDKLALDIFNEASFALGISVSNVINLLGIATIVVGGGIANAWDLFYENTYNTIKNNVFQYQQNNLKLVKAKLGEKAGVIGAAYMAAEK